MVLSSLLVLLALAAMSNYQRIFTSIRKTGDTQTQINMFYGVLNNDMQRANKIYFDNNLLCAFDDYEVSYSFMEDKIVRNASLVVDTFHLKYGLPTIIPSFDIEELVGQVSINCYNGEALYPISIVKKYPAGIKFEMLK
jgi:hypothetical protein